jgi:hypothetical protein
MGNVSRSLQALGNTSSHRKSKKSTGSKSRRKIEISPGKHKAQNQRMRDLEESVKRLEGIRASL